MLFDSIRAFSVFSSSFRIRGIASARSPILVLTHSEPLRTCSQIAGRVCSA